MNTKIFQLKVTLSDSKPAIWRQISAPADFPFFSLHVAIQDVFGWEDCHLHQFFTDAPYKRNSQYQLIALPTPDDYFNSRIKTIDERQAKLSDFFHQPKDKMYYEYDFGDGWMHEIKLEKILTAEVKEERPRILAGAGACPPEDCGGIGGYYRLLDVLKNPKDPEYQDMLGWLGIEEPSELQPDKFDFNSVSFRDPAKVLKYFERELNI